jgi:hypothetical protein
LVVVLLLIPASAPAEDLVITTGPRQKAETVRLLVPADQNGGTYVLYLSNSTDKPVEGAGLLATLWKLAAGDSATYYFRIYGLGPGSYRGKVVTTGPDNVTVERSFTVTVKHPFLWALAVVVVGALPAFGLYYWIRVGRDFSLRAAQVAEVREDL